MNTKEIISIIITLALSIVFVMFCSVAIDLWQKKKIRDQSEEDVRMIVEKVNRIIKR